MKIASFQERQGLLFFVIVGNPIWCPHQQSLAALTRGQYWQMLGLGQHLL